MASLLFPALNAKPSYTIANQAPWVATLYNTTSFVDLRMSNLLSFSSFTVLDFYGRAIRVA